MLTFHHLLLFNTILWQKVRILVFSNQMTCFCADFSVRPPSTVFFICLVAAVVVEPECEKSSATTYFWYRQTLNITSTIDDTGGLNWKMTLSLLVAWILVCLAVIKGIQSSGKVLGACCFTVGAKPLIYSCELSAFWSTQQRVNIKTIILLTKVFHFCFFNHWLTPISAGSIDLPFIQR